MQGEPRNFGRRIAAHIRRIGGSEGARLARGPKSVGERFVTRSKAVAILRSAGDHGDEADRACLDAKAVVSHPCHLCELLQYSMKLRPGKELPKWRQGLATCGDTWLFTAVASLIALIARR